ETSNKEHEEKVLPTSSPTAVVHHGSSDKAKAIAETPHISLQSDTSLPTKSTGKKRERPAATTPVVKKLFKESAQDKHNDT
ncbi:hypothetical protein E2562_007523, partial [Oryza meyeriana var. granulata]